VDDADLAATAGLARAHGLPVHIHASENRDQTATSLARHGLTPIEVLERTGILDTDVLLAHGTGIIERDLPLLAGATGSTAVASAPRGYLRSVPCTTSASPSDSPPTVPPPTTPSTCGSRWRSPL
jgi:5-methylthioadenosine/S-adenosylhomocysteine deaminase